MSKLELLGRLDKILEGDLNDIFNGRFQFPEDQHDEIREELHNVIHTTVDKSNGTIDQTMIDVSKAIGVWMEERMKVESKSVDSEDNPE